MFPINYSDTPSIKEFITNNYNKQQIWWHHWRQKMLLVTPANDPIVPKICDFDRHNLKEEKTKFLVSMGLGVRLYISETPPSLAALSLLLVCFFYPWLTGYNLTQLHLLSDTHLNVVKLTLVCCYLLHGYSFEVCQ